MIPEPERAAALIAKCERLLKDITPGEWRVTEDERVACAPLEISINGAPIATVLNADDFPCLSGEDDEAKIEQVDREAQANADFIAAAPRLVRDLLAHVRQPQQSEPPLVAYMTATTRAARSAAFLRTYAERLRNGTAASWEIPNTVASTLEDIAAHVSQQDEGLRAYLAREEALQQVIAEMKAREHEIFHSQPGSPAFNRSAYGELRMWRKLLSALLGREGTPRNPQSDPASPERP